MTAQRSINGGLDQYYTDPDLALSYIKSLTDIIKDYNIKVIIEPSAGNGSFYNQFNDVFNLPVLGYDLDPKISGIVKTDFFDVKVKKHSAVIGNPPFGFAASLAVKFFNHAAKNADIIAFIIPRSFKKSSIQNKLNKNFHLLSSVDCPKNSFILNNLPYDVPCCFQIWTRKTYQRKDAVIYKNNPFFEFTTKENANIAIRRVGGRAGQFLSGTDYNINSTFFCYADNIEAAKMAMESIQDSIKDIRDHTAGVRSISKSELNHLLNNI